MEYNNYCFTLSGVVLSALISAGISLYIANRSKKSQERMLLDKMLEKMIELSIEYPYLEDDAFCDKWPGIDPSNEEMLRYDNYCCFVFNFLELVYFHFDGNPEKIRKFIYIPEIAFRHKLW